ncbi:hypothetical protein [Gilvimarinus chinensis]|uniref:hypothetical protein n=1 Tax=Gilvimarinus chinensis TaxID=396005 RepID=UPI00036AA700|nr:hypothetical protein [Gilvimarinus chinensis]
MDTLYIKNLNAACFMAEVATLQKKYKAKLTYTNDDDGIHAVVEGRDFCIGHDLGDYGKTFHVAHLSLLTSLPFGAISLDGRIKDPADELIELRKKIIDAAAMMKRVVSDREPSPDDPHNSHKEGVDYARSACIDIMRELLNH